MPLSRNWPNPVKSVKNNVSSSISKWKNEKKNQGIMSKQRTRQMPESISSASEGYSMWRKWWVALFLDTRNANTDIEN